MKQDRKLRNKPMHLWSMNPQQRRQDYTMLKKQFLQQMILGKLDSYMQKNEIDYYFKSYTKVSSKWIKDLNIGLKP